MHFPLALETQNLVTNLLPTFIFTRLPENDRCTTRDAMEWWRVTEERQLEGKREDKLKYKEEALKSFRRFVVHYDGYLPGRLQDL